MMLLFSGGRTNLGFIFLNSLSDKEYTCNEEYANQ